jgi:deoxyribonuclease (pyrimidine dimer)
MIPPLLRKNVQTGKIRRLQIPKSFVLGTGHMTFWLDKMFYLHNRHQMLTAEMISRGFNPDITLTLDVDLAKSYGLYNDWTPDANAIKAIKQRISSRIQLQFSWYRFRGNPITAEWFDDIYN